MELVNARSSYTPPNALTEMLKKIDSDLCHSVSSEIRSLNKRVQLVVKSRQGNAGQVRSASPRHGQDRPGGVEREREREIVVPISLSPD